MHVRYAVGAVISCAFATSAGAQEVNLPLEFSVDPPYRLEATGFRDVVFHADGDGLSVPDDTLELCIDTNLDFLRLRIATQNGAVNGHNLLRDPASGSMLGYSLHARFTGPYRPLLDGADELFPLEFVPIAAAGCSPDGRMMKVRIAPLVTPTAGVVSLSEAVEAFDLAPGERRGFTDRIHFTFSPAFTPEAY